MYEVMIEEEFSAAHALRGYRGKCENLHGHNWKVEVYVRGERLDSVGMLVDFKELKPFDIEMNPSSEHIAGFILHRVAEEINSDKVKVYKVRVWETPTTSATYEIN